MSIGGGSDTSSRRSRHPSLGSCASDVTEGTTSFARRNSLARSFARVPISFALPALAVPLPPLSSCFLPDNQWGLPPRPAGGGPAAGFSVHRIIGFGHPLLDICKAVGYDWLDRYNVDKGSMQLAEPHHLPVYEDLLHEPDVSFVAGGATMNAIRVCCWMLRSPDEKLASYVGCVGKDKYRDILLKSLEQSNITALMQEHDTEPTGTCACLVVDKERTLITNLGAARMCSIEHILGPEVEAAMDKAHLFYFAGFFLNVAALPDAHMHIAEHCLHHDKLLCINLSATFLCEVFKEPLLQLMPYVDYLFSNEEECQAWSRANGWGTDDVIEVVKKCVALPKKGQSRPRVVVVTRGRCPTVVGMPTCVRTYAVRSVGEELIVDTNACGDSFVGGFLSQLAQGKPLADCVAAGHYAAWEIIQQNGCTIPAHVAHFSAAA